MRNHPIGNFEYDDVYQEACIAFWVAAEKWQPDKSALTTYAYRVIFHRLSRVIAATGYEITIPESSLGKVERMIMVADDLEPSLGGSIEDDHGIHDYLPAALTDGERETLIAVFEHGLTQQEIADSRGQSRSRVARQYQAGLDKVRLTLSEAI